MKSGSDDPSGPKTELTYSRLRLKQAREAAGKKPKDLGKFVGGSANYHDLENCDGDLYSSIRLGDLSALCSDLGIKVHDLFGGLTGDSPMISPEQLMWKVNDYLREKGMSIAEFEKCIGFEIEPSLKDSAKVMDWSVDFLRWFCREMGLDWRLALP